MLGLLRRLLRLESPSRLPTPELIKPGEVMQLMIDVGYTKMSEGGGRVQLRFNALGQPGANFDMKIADARELVDKLLLACAGAET